MQVCEEYGDTITYRVADARDGARNLLKRLLAEHDYNMRPPAGWRPRAILPPPTRREWFSIVPDDEDAPEPPIKAIKRAACEYFEISMIDIESARRTADMVYPRQIAMYLARVATRKSTPEIGRRFGGRDHTTVLHAFNKIKLHARLDWKVAYDVAHVEAMI